jgi:hypothetical protein
MASARRFPAAAPACGRYESDRLPKSIDSPTKIRASAD